MIDIGSSVVPDTSSPTGIIPILVTPFTSAGEVDVVALERQVDFLRQRGIRWVGMGFGSEAPQLSRGELATVVSGVKAAGSGSMRIIGNIDVRSLPSAVEQANEMCAAGADWVLARPGGSAGATQAGLGVLFSELVHRSPVPIIIQDAPQNTGITLADATLVRLLNEHVGSIGVKLESPDAVRKMGLIAPDVNQATPILGGRNGIEFLQELGRGANGCMPGPAFADVFVQVMELYRQGDYRPAYDAFGLLLPLLLAGSRDLECFLFTQKYTLVRRGVLPHADIRQPHGTLDDRLRREVDDLLTICDLVDLVGPHGE